MSVILQAFEWNLINDGHHFQFLKDQIPSLQQAGFDALWLPPFCKGTSDQDVGYGIYDLYDLGEFDQKGSVRTKYGTKEDLIALINQAHDADFKVYADVVLNHKASADETETFLAIEVDPQNRLKDLGEPYEIEGWTKFTFPGRNKRYSDFVWKSYHFSGVDYDQRTGKNAIYRILGENKYWAEGVSQEKGNFDYLMFADIDHQHPEVIQEIFSWHDWLVQETKIDGYRFDALKHIDDEFILKFIHHIRREQARENFYLFGEYWDGSPQIMQQYLEQMEYRLDLFDVKLHFNMHDISKNPEGSDLRTIFDGSLLRDFPMQAVSFVENHDTQRGSGLQSPIEDWFKPIAYAVILLQKDGYPCVFFPDYYGYESDQASFQTEIDNLLFYRNKMEGFEQRDFFLDDNCIGWLRYNGEEAFLIILSIDGQGTRSIELGEDFAQCIFKTQSEEYVSDQKGHIVVQIPEKSFRIYSCYSK